MVARACNPSYSEAEAGELPEPRRRRLRWAKIAPLHSSLGNKSETPSQKTNKQKKHLFADVSIILTPKPDKHSNNINKNNMVKSLMNIVSKIL